jgi:hypothetical protein
VNPTSVRPPPFCTAGKPLRSYPALSMVIVFSAAAALQNAVQKLIQTFLFLGSRS